MNKFIYILVSLIFAVNFWNLSAIVNSLSPDIILVLSWGWILSGIYYFNETKRRKALNNYRYNKTAVHILAGVFISMVSAYFFGHQSFMTTFVAQRTIYGFMLLPAILFVQPTEKDIVKALKWISIGTMVVWGLVHINPHLVQLDKESMEKFEMGKQDLSAKLEFYVNGIHLVVLYLYFKITEYIETFSWKVFLEAGFIVLFVILYQNRSLILGVAPVFIYSIIRFKSKYKSSIIIALSVILVGIIILTSDVWLSMFTSTQNNLGESDYNRWKSLYYYFFEYSPNWFCYIFGNGFPSGGNSSLGVLMWKNFERGIFASDLGMIGMWVDYGIIPLIAIYAVLINVLRRKYMPLAMKFISLHIILVPTIFHFWTNPGIALFVLIIYLNAHYTEKYKKLLKDASDNISQL